MKKYLFILVFVLGNNAIIWAQLRNPTAPQPYPTTPVRIACTAQGTVACNYIQNQSLQVSAGTDPSAGENTFAYGLINNWANSSGSPSIVSPFGTDPLPAGLNCNPAYIVTANSGGIANESLYGRIFPLTTGQNYILNFYSNLHPSTNINPTTDPYEYVIYLFKSCTDQASYFPSPNSYTKLYKATSTSGVTTNIF